MVDLIIYLIGGIAFLVTGVFAISAAVISGDISAKESAGFRDSEGLPPCPQIGGSSPPSPIEEEKK